MSKLTSFAFVLLTLLRLLRSSCMMSWAPSCHLSPQISSLVYLTLVLKLELCLLLIQANRCSGFRYLVKFRTVLALRCSFAFFIPYLLRLLVLIFLVSYGGLQ